MVMPALTVTAIGVLAVLATAFVAREHPSARGVVYALAGAWAGFVVGGLAGLVADVITGGGTSLAIMGHSVAVVGAAIGSHIGSLRLASPLAEEQWSLAVGDLPESRMQRTNAGGQLRSRAGHGNAGRDRSDR